MSLAAMNAVWEHSRANANNLAVLLAIADNADDEGRAYPKQETIAKKTRVSVRTVQRCIQELRDMGELLIDRTDQRLNNNYVVIVAQLKGPAPRRQVDASKPDAPTSDGVSTGTRQPVVSDSSNPEDTRQVDGSGRQVVADTGGGSDTTLRSPHNRHVTDLSQHAREDRPPSLIGRGESLQWSQAMEKHHAKCHPEVCHWRNGKIPTCMPMALVDEYARKLTNRMPLDAAIADVVAWAASDRPAADYEAPETIFAHWSARWKATRMTAAPTASSAAPAGARASAVPSADETRTKYLEKRA